MGGVVSGIYGKMSSAGIIGQVLYINQQLNYNNKIIEHVQKSYIPSRDGYLALGFLS